jgi:hypothetical protein
MKNIAELKDINGKNDIAIKVEGKEYVEIISGKRKSKINFLDLYNIVFIIANEEQKCNLIPTFEERIKEHRVQLTIKAQKDIKKGEDIIVNYAVKTPQKVG